MKTSHLFWGFFFITIGALYLIERYSSFFIDWYFLWDLWPLIIIIVGIAIIFKGTFVKPVISILLGIFVAFLIFGFINDIFNGFPNRKFERKSRDIVEQNYSIPLNDSVRFVHLKIEAGAGKFQIEDATDNLIESNVKSDISKYNFHHSQRDSSVWVNIEMDKFGNQIFGRSKENKIDVRLNELPKWSFDINIGAAKSYFDLRPFKVQNLVLNTGATETKIKLGDKNEMTYLNVNMGAASLTVHIPETSGCKVTGDMVLMSKELKGFDKKESSYYYTSNYDEAKQKIIIEVNGGVSSFKVVRY